MAARTKLLSVAAALAAAACGAPAAHAADLYGMGKDIAYDVKVEGQGKYTYSEHIDRAGGDWYGQDVALDFTYTGEISDGVVFRNASPLDTTGDDIPQLTATGTYTDTGSGPANTPCAVDTTYHSAGGLMRMVDDADLTGVSPLDGSMDLWIRPLEHFDVMFACPVDVHSHPMATLVGMPDFDDDLNPDGTVTMGHNPFDIKYNLPRDLVGMGQIQQLDPAKVVEGVACPGWIADQTTACRLEWTAKVTLTKLWEKAVPGTTTQPPPKTNDDGLILPLVPTKPPAKADDDDLIVPLVPPSKAKLSADASKATFSVSCAAGCSGTASVSAGAGGGAQTRAVAAKAAKALATVTFTVAAGKAKTVTIRLGAKARKAIRRARGARIAVRTTTRGKTQTKTLTLRLPKQARH